MHVIVGLTSASAVMPSLAPASASSSTPVPPALHAMTCKWWYSPNGHVAKVSGQSECKSHSWYPSVPRLEPFGP